MCLAEIERKYNLIFQNILYTFRLLYILYMEMSDAMSYRIYNLMRRKVSIFKIIMSDRSFRLFKSRNVFRLLRKI